MIDYMDMPDEITVLYSELMERCLTHGTAPMEITFTQKNVKGNTYWYAQRMVGGKKIQKYIGPANSETAKDINRHKKLQASPELNDQARLVTMLARGGANVLSPLACRVLKTLEQAGIFNSGAVMVGSQAFALYGNMLGVHWQNHLTRTNDLDIAAQREIKVGIRKHSKKDTGIPLGEVWEDFTPVPPLNHKDASTRFKTWGGARINLEILCPMTGKTSSKPVYMNGLKTYAEPVRFLEYLLADAQPAVVLYGSGILVKIPPPASFALHKLVVSERRRTHQSLKRKKDVLQSEALLSVLLEGHDGEILEAVTTARKIMPVKFLTQLKKGFRKLSPEIHARINSMVKLW